MITPQPGFESPLRVELLRPQVGSLASRWMLVEPLVFHSVVADAKFTVPAGFVTDFASVPRVPILFELLGGIASEAATLHDWLYTKPHVVDRETADKVLREAAIAIGVSEVRADALYLGVREFGESHWE